MSKSSDANKQAAADKAESVRSGTDRQEQSRADRAADNLEQRYGLSPREDRDARKNR